MSCDGTNGFGYIEVKDNKVIVHTGASNNPTIHEFCNDEFVHAVKLLREVKERFEGERAVYNDKSSTDDMKERSMFVATVLQGLLEKTKP